MKKIEYNGNKQKAYAFIDSLDATSTMWVIEARPIKELRTYLQNKLSHAWYVDLASFDSSDTPSGWKCYCKLHHGVVIMRRDNMDFRNAYDDVIKGLSYEKKLQVMKILPVTSLMNTKQLNEYLESIQNYFNGLGADLTFPDDCIDL